METLKDILLQFGISPEGSRFERIAQGLINSTYFVCFGKERKYVLQRINEYVFPNSQALSHNLEQVLPHLCDPDYGVDMAIGEGGKLVFLHEKGWLSVFQGSPYWHITPGNIVLHKFQIPGQEWTPPGKEIIPPGKAKPKPGKGKKPPKVK